MTLRNLALTVVRGAAAMPQTKTQKARYSRRMDLDFIALSQACAPWVAHETMAAIVKTESNFQPLTIGVNHGAQLAHQPRNKSEAVATAEWLIAKGYNIDIGLAQINSANLRKTGLTIKDAFDPCKNLAAAAKILYWDYQTARHKFHSEQTALHAAISAYNTGSFTKGIANGYVQKVLNNIHSATTVPVVTPIPLIKGNTPKATRKTAVIQRKTQPTPVRPPVEDDDTSVYGSQSIQHNVMVY